MKNLDLVKSSILINDEKLERLNDKNEKFKLGIVGGTFDPIHNAHLAMVEFVRTKFNLDFVLFIPSGTPPHKMSISTDKHDRYNMVLLATASNEYFAVSDYEVKAEKRSYTVDTLKDMKKIYSLSDIYFITGADAICTIEEWKDARGILESATFIATTRPGIGLLRAQETIEKLNKKYNANIISVYVPSLDISSTYIRDQLLDGKSVKYLIPSCVEEYIYQNCIYKNETKKHEQLRKL
ncbi:MAG: nicotinate-nucleotide adenylyltransferase [Clostridioides sp.]|jgi:nicotinate-nucleotide adenylyltransferase|nr:nicotinate-nucleotide adenylyltransferase [Clostridioides sp.]